MEEGHLRKRGPNKELYGDVGFRRNTRYPRMKIDEDEEKRKKGVSGGLVPCAQTRRKMQDEEVENKKKISNAMRQKTQTVFLQIDEESEN